jgi:hypothetical protein
LTKYCQYKQELIISGTKNEHFDCFLSIRMPSPLESRQLIGATSQTLHSPAKLNHISTARKISGLSVSLGVYGWNSQVGWRPFRPARQMSLSLGTTV